MKDVVDVALALIALGQALIVNGASIITALGIALSIYLTWRNGRSVKDAKYAAEAAREAAVVSGVKVDNINQLAAVNGKTIELIQDGAFRQGHVAGAALVRQQISDFAPLASQGASDFQVTNSSPL